MDHGTRAPVLEPYPRNVLPRVRPIRPQHETHGEKHHAVEHGPVVVRHRLRHLPNTPLFLSKGLKALGREYHLALAIIVLAIWSLQSFIPGAQSLTDNVFGFIYVFILISAYKWHMMPFTTKQVWLMTGIGLGFFLLYTAASATPSLLGYDMGIFITGSWKLPVIMVGFGMFLLFDRVTFHSRVINRIAQSAFAVYLITGFCRIRKTALGQVVQPARPLPATIRDPADPRHPAGDLYHMHSA